MKHWTHFLPEAGTITRKGEDQILLHARIEHHRKQFEILQEEYDNNEEDITLTAKKEWTEEEIKAAKVQCANDGLHPVFQTIIKAFMP